LKLTLHKNKRIKQKRIFDALFQSGSGESKFAYPIRINWVESSEFTNEPLKVAFVVPKRLFKRAVDRNALKRKMKETYRINQTRLLEALSQKKQSFSILFMYQAKKKLPYSNIEKAMHKVVQKFMIIYELD